MVILLFREFHFWLDSKLELSCLCLTFTKFDVGISLGLDFTTLWSQLLFSVSSACWIEFELAPRFSGFLFFS